MVATHTQFVADCVFPHTNHQILTASGDGLTALWDIEDGTKIQECHHTNSLNIVSQKLNIISEFPNARCHFRH